jgi:hypothetical protein
MPPVLRALVAILSFYRRVLKQCLEIKSDGLLSHPYPFITNANVFTSLHIEYLFKRNGVQDEKESIGNERRVLTLKGEYWH